MSHIRKNLKLGEFIVQNLELILMEWEKFAREIQPEGGDLSVTELRDHAGEMLGTIAQDLDTPQTEQQRFSKSRGDTPHLSVKTAAEVHADERLRVGFSIDLLVAEYRALRASVLHLWLVGNQLNHPDELQDLMRFNEAIDQALAESVSRYSQAVQMAQDVFLGTLGHDLRAPLQSIGSGAQYLIHAPEVKDVDRLGTRIYNSVRRMSGMLDNLFDFTVSRLGGGIRIDPSSVDLADIAEHVVEEFRSYSPLHAIYNEVIGDCKGLWDADRVGQVYQNLIGNALQHGEAHAAVTVSTIDERDSVLLRVHNFGPPIPEKEQSGVFELLHRKSDRAPEAAPSRNLGLGLYIVREIATAHHGSVSVTSTEGSGTTFEVRLPKHVGS